MHAILRRLPSLVVSFAVLSAFVPSSGCYSEDTTVTPVATDAGSDTARPRIVCGQTGSVCAGNEWCEYGLVGSCGREGQNGSCAARPANCEDGSCPGVCGCDGKAYCNACLAHFAGSDVDKNRTCFPAGGEVLAYAILQDPARIVIFKKDDARKICLRVTLVARLSPKFGLDISDGQWGVESSEITNDPADCSITTVGTPPTPDTSLAPNGGQGRVTFSQDRGKQGKYPCSLSLNARLAFEPDAEFAWVPNVELIEKDNVTVEGACP